MFGINKNKKETLHQGGKIGVNPRPTSQPPSAPGENINEIDNECVCSCDNIGVLSAVRRFVKTSDKEINFVDVTLICHHCGRTKKETKFLYEE